MDADRFDALARALGARLPRRALGGLVAALAALGADGAGAGARRADRGRRGAGGGGDGRRGAGAAGRRRRDAEAGGLRAAGRKKGGAKKKGNKKGKKKGGGNGGVACPRGLKPCNGGCVPRDEPCCRDGERPCGGACVPADACCESGFARCVAPLVADWQQAADGCGEACADPGSAACDECARGVLEALAAPLARCAQINCPDGGGGGEAATAERTAVAASPALRQCQWDKLVDCHFNALLQNFGVGAATSAWGLVTEGPLGAGAAALLQAGLFQADLGACDQQFGCPGGWCDPTHEVCCPFGNCLTYDPGTKTCRRCTDPDSYCQTWSETCRKGCKQCRDYDPVECGSITNNCGDKIRCGSSCHSWGPDAFCDEQTNRCGCSDGITACASGMCGYHRTPSCDRFIDCGGCRSGYTCEGGTCRAICPRSGARAQGAGDECCLPGTCEELGKTCGAWDDGCGGTVQCGGCADGHECDDGRCVCPSGHAVCDGVCCPSGQACGGSGGACAPVNPCDLGPCRVQGTIHYLRTQTTSKDYGPGYNSVHRNYHERREATFTVGEDGRMVVEIDFLATEDRTYGCDHDPPSEPPYDLLYHGVTTAESAFSGPVDPPHVFEHPPVGGGGYQTPNLWNVYVPVTTTTRLEPDCSRPGSESVETSRRRVPVFGVFEVGPASADFAWSGSWSTEFPIDGGTQTGSATWDLRLVPGAPTA